MGRGFAILRVVLGLLLLTSAGLKLYGLNTTEAPETGWFGSPQIQLAGTSWELMLGLWLLSGANPFGAWPAAVVTFLAFASLSAYRGWTGAASCACFGSLRTNPWFTFWLDVSAMAALAAWRPADDSSCSRSCLPRRLAATGILLMLLLAVVPAGTVLWYGLRFERPREGIVAEPKHIDLGVLARGGNCSYVLKVRNWTDAPVIIRRVEVSCDCMTVRPNHLVLAAGGVAELAVGIDLTRSPRFLGELSLNIRGFTDNGLAFSANAALNIVPG